MPVSLLSALRSTSPEQFVMPRMSRLDLNSSTVISWCVSRLTRFRGAETLLLSLPALSPLEVQSVDAFDAVNMLLS